MRPCKGRFLPPGSVSACGSPYCAPPHPTSPGASSLRIPFFLVLCQSLLWRSVPLLFASIPSCFSFPITPFSLSLFSFGVGPFFPSPPTSAVPSPKTMKSWEMPFP